VHLRHSHTDQRGAYGRKDGLTDFAAGLTTVIIAALQPGGTCEAGNTDWRSTLPRFIAQRLAGRADLLLWDAKHAIRSTLKNESFDNDSGICDTVGLDSKRPYTVNAMQWFQGRRNKHAELVIVVGSLRPPWRELLSTLDQPWVSSSTKFVHLPISREDDVLQNKIANFDLVLPDEVWVKPVHMEDIQDFRATCRTVERDNKLVYIARYHNWKGQLTFMKTVDPELLRGYTLEFFTSKNSEDSSEREEIIAIGKERGINVVAHTSKMAREDLLPALCKAKGVIHYALDDANPRAVYEAFLAGLPAIISRQARVPLLVQSQTFVVMTDAKDSAALNHDFRNFMAIVERRAKLKLDNRIDTFIEDHMAEEKALATMCMYMGICARHEERHNRQADGVL